MAKEKVTKESAAAESPEKAKKATAKTTKTTEKKAEKTVEKTVVEPAVETIVVENSDSSKGNTEKELSVEQKLSNLYQLQLMLSEIDKIKTLRGELPLEVQDLEDEVAGLQTRVQNFQLDVKDLEATIGQQKIKISDSNALIAKYKEQLENVRNNREFDSLSKEVEFQGLEVELAEKKMREFAVEVKTINEEILKCKTLLDDRQIDLKMKKEELDEIVSETRIQEEQLREKAKQLETSIETRLLTAFKRIRKSARNGLAVVYIQRDACGGCFNKIPPQRQMDIKLRKKIIVCEHCGRIMIDPRFAGIE